MKMAMMLPLHYDESDYKITVGANDDGADLMFIVVHDDSHGADDEVNDDDTDEDEHHTILKKLKIFLPTDNALNITKVIHDSLFSHIRCFVLANKNGTL